MLWYLAGYQFVSDISETVVLMEHPSRALEKTCVCAMRMHVIRRKIEIKKGRYTTKEEQQKNKTKNFKLQ